MIEFFEKFRSDKFQSLYYVQNLNIVNNQNLTNNKYKKINFSIQLNQEIIDSLRLLKFLLNKIFK